jgi:hypothetical protein
LKQSNPKKQHIFDYLEEKMVICRLPKKRKIKEGQKQSFKDVKNVLSILLNKVGY